MVDLDPNCDDDDELEHSSPSSASLPSTPYLDNNDLNNTVQSNHNTRQRTNHQTYLRPNLNPIVPNRKEVNNIRPRVLPNPIAARRIQTLYRLSKKRAARQILNDNNTVYSSTKEQAKDYFTNTFANNHINIDEVLESLNRHVPTANEDPTVMEPMSEKCIKSKLKKTGRPRLQSSRVHFQQMFGTKTNTIGLERIHNYTNLQEGE